MEDLIEKYLGEVHGRGMGHVLDKVKGNDTKKLEQYLKSKKIRYSKDKSGNVVVGDDDFDEVEEFMIRKLGIF